jgi:hypothetical protein
VVAIGRRFGAAGLVLAAMAMANVSTAAHGQTPRAYKDGLDAVEKRDWPNAARLMRQAAGERGEERKKYTPYYYLGQALFEQGDCDGAEAAWKESERQKALPRDLLERVRDGRARCTAARSRRDTNSAAEQQARAAVDEAARADEATQELLRAGPEQLWRQGKPSLRERMADAESRLDAARGMIEKAGSGDDPGAFGDAERMARQIVDDFEQIRKQASGLRSEHGDRQKQQRGKVDTLATTARQLLRDTAYLSPYPAQVRRKRSDLEALLAELDKAGVGADEAYLQGLSSRIQFSTNALTEITAQPPTALQHAADAFFAGAYARVLEILVALPDGSARSRAHALLLRAAARYYLWVENGERDQAVLAAAAADADACRRTDAALAPPSALFSPRFREFFASPGARPGTP